jgi:hypothetical protein
MSKVIVDTLENTAGTFTSAVDSLGPSTTYGAVGTYVGGFVNAGASVYVDNNTNKAGSSIQIYSGNTSDGNTFNVQNTGNLKSAGLSGTWKCMSAYEASDINYLWGSIWMRIS